MRRFLAAFLILMASSTVAQARTWRVEKDGSGDYAIIQAAIDAAADGDTIRIGAGRFDAFATQRGMPINVYLDGQKSLVLSGAGAEATIIGPAALTDDGVRYGIAAESGPASLRVEHLAVVNANEYAMSAGCADLRVEDCRIEGALKGIVSFGETFALVDSRIVNGPPLDLRTRGLEIASPHALVQGVTVAGYWYGISAMARDTDDVRITGCTLDGGGVGNIGIDAWNGDAVIDHCRVTGWTGAAIMVGTASTVTLDANVVEDNPGTGVDVYLADDLVMTDNLIRGCGTCLVVSHPNRQQSIRRNSFLRNEAVDGYLVVCDTPGFVEPETLDFSGNYWGTTDTATIDRWIDDGNDTGTGVTIGYLPLLEASVPTGSTSFGGLRALYR